jgi:molybdopterin-guanine dinucleotide biosynthesis protein A
MDSLKILILAGGHSSRMGSPKHLLPVPPTDRPLYQHLISIICVALPATRTIHVSVANISKSDDALDYGQLCLTRETDDSRVDLVKIPDTATQEIGPSAGLLAAHQHDPGATWLIVACDFPLLDPAALRQLKEVYQDPVTCFVNKDGFSEPLLAIWSSQALQALSENVLAGRAGPNYTIKRLGAKLISPSEDEWIFNTNTPEEWEDAKRRIRTPQSARGV